MAEAFIISAVRTPIGLGRAYRGVGFTFTGGADSFGLAGSGQACRD